MVPCSRVRKCRQSQRLRAAAEFTDLVTYEGMIKKWSREFFHNSSYRGKAAQIKRNSSATVATNATETTAAAESTAAETNAANESTAAHETTTAAPSSPDGETKAPTTTAAASNEGMQGDNSRARGNEPGCGSKWIMEAIKIKGKTKVEI